VEHDVVVVGSGAGALVGAYRAASLGLRTVVLEKTAVLGGTSAYSGGSMYLPGNHVSQAAGHDDTVERARTYLEAVIGPGDERREAFVTTAAEVVAFLDAHPRIELFATPIPEYFDAPGRWPGGAQIGPVMLPAAEVDPALLALVRDTITNDRLGTHPERGELWGGQSLITRLLIAFTEAGGEVRTGHCVDRLLVEDGRVVGVEAVTDAGRVEVRAGRGVLLASGGFERNAALRDRYGVPGDAAFSMAPRETNTGEPIEAAMAVGAAVDLMDQGWFCPGLHEPDGGAGFYMGLRGGVFVNAQGERFANESQPYDRMGREMAKLSPEAWYVFDSRERGRPPGVRCVPGTRREAFLASGDWVERETLAELAEAIGVPADALAVTVERWNSFCAKGVDEDFHRGEDEFDRYFAFGDPPNPCLVPLDRPPYVAARVVLGDLGTKGGLVTDADARVLREDGTVIPGLFAAGNTMASIAGAFYPAPGTPIGTAVVFAYRAASALST
jgi:3-oxosteroid 1-dehydrogenase